MSEPSDRVLDRLTALHPKVIDLSLGRIERLLAALGHPERRLPPVVHVYTSPHLARFHERIRLAGRLIEEERLAALLERCEAANAGEPITFFEITTAAAFLAMAETPADWCLLEVGLGGRLDATNVVDRPRLAVVTPVSLDHQQYLGETLAEIAGEKAGILKPGVPAVVGPQEPAALAAIEARAEAVGAPLAIANHDWQVWEEHGRMAFLDQGGLLDLPLPVLIGAHQVANAGIALAGLRALGFGEAACTAAVTRAEWPARLQRLRRGPLVEAAGRAELWLDGGHNPHGGAAIAQTLGDLEERAPKPLILIVGMMGQKDASGFLAPFRNLARRVVTVPIPGAHEAPHEPRALAATALALGLAVETATSVPAALDRIKATSTGPMRVLICGSLYLAGHVLALNEGRVVQAG
jgi:dihydrofolate synthase/folylpolyglutamate synthase